MARNRPSRPHASSRPRFSRPSLEALEARTLPDAGQLRALLMERLAALLRGGQSPSVPLAPPPDLTPPTIAIYAGAPNRPLNHNVPFRGRVTDDRSGVAALQVQVDSGPLRFLPAGRLGYFSFVSQFPLNGSRDGRHRVRFRALDGVGNLSFWNTTFFTLDTRKPTAPSFDLAAPSDTAPVGDRQTTLDRVTLTGRTEPGSLVTLVETRQKVTADRTGKFSFTGVALQLGENTFTVKATDAARNASVFVGKVTRVSTELPPPAVSAALQNDTGASADDKVTADPAVSGTVVGSTPITLFKAGLDGTAPAGFTDVLADLQAGGAFALSRARLDQIAGGTLADGAHVLHLQAGDQAGRSTTFDLSFTLDRSAPGVQITAPAAASLVNSNVAVLGGVTDAGSSVASLRGQVDAGPFFPVSFDPATGSFRVDTALLLDGTADGGHTVRVEATDKAGNVSALSSVSFTLDTRPPAVPAFDLAPTTADLGPLTTSARRVTLVGTAEPGVKLSLVGTSLTALASAAGTFQIPGVDLAVGANALVLRSIDPAGNSSGDATLTVTRNEVSGQQSPVLVWNQAALNAISLDASAPTYASRALAMVQSAVYDAVNAIAGTPAYYVRLSAPAGASAPAAVSTAAHRVLSYLYPAQQATFDTLLATALAGVPDGSSKTDGMAVGVSVGNAIIAQRAGDGFDGFVAYTPTSGAGEWQPTPPMYAESMDPQWATMAPFAMTSPSQFRPGGAPALTSQEWADATNEVKSLGSATSTTRTADQTAIARFWADGAGTVSPPGHWNTIAAQFAQQQGGSLLDDARLFAVLNVAMADAAIVAWDAKYEYTTWRPVTAIRNAPDAGNPAVTADPTWTSLLGTPPFPEYISGHSTFSAAAATVLTSFFGDNVGFSSSVTIPSGATLTRSFTSFDQAAQEAGRSRIYGGIHFEFSNQDGQASGKALANYVLHTFDVSQDVAPPKVIVDNVLPLGATRTNFTATGQVSDTLSGVAKLEVQVDQGAFTSLAFDAMGKFSFLTTFALDGTADGAHAIHFRATDAAGNVSELAGLDFALGTKAPTLTMTGPAGGAELDPAAMLTGTVTTTGPALASLSYAFDGGMSVPMTFDPDDGSFSERLVQSRLGTGAHTLVVTARDTAGNVTSQTVNVTLAAPILLQLTSVTPDEGASEVGVTFRPKVTFSRPIDTATLTGANFYATDPAGTKLPATVVASDDGTYAWLFFAGPMPGASKITLTVDGATIRTADGSLLDAVGLGVVGSKLVTSFTTVSLATVAGTSLSGTVADPGVDLKPMSFDDVKPGPDGVTGTADDVYKLPIEHVKVFILGHEDQAVFTDAQGRFELTAVPAGEVKLALDGRTSTNAPAGYFFPEMVMALNLVAGVANTVMGTMGTAEQQLANATVKGVYLPRVQSAVLQTVSATQTTTVGVDAVSAPNLTPEERQLLKIEVAPNSLVGEDGQRLTNAQIGISTVPPELVRDMLPAGLLQHTFDITIQAPGVATLTTPAKMTFPNVFNAAPGTKLNFLSFDHTTGMLVIDGTATVSEDGKYVVTDPDNGITHPGWHGVTPPGGCSGVGAPPPPPPPPTPNDTSDPLERETLELIVDEGGSFDFDAMEWTAPDALPGTPPVPPDPSGCPSPAPDLPNMKQPYVQVKVEVDGKLSDFMKQAGDVPLNGDSFILRAGTGQKRKLDFDAKTFAELSANGVKDFEKNVLFGSSIKVTVITGRPDGSTHTKTKEIFLARYIDATDDDHTDGRTEFAKTINDGAGGEHRVAPIEIRAGSQKPAIEIVDGAQFYNASSINELWFDPVSTGLISQTWTDSFRVKNPADDHVAGTVKLRGEATSGQHVYVDKDSVKAALAAIASKSDPNTNYTNITAAELALFDTDAERATIADGIASAMYSFFGSVSKGILTGSSSFFGDITIDFKTSTSHIFGIATPPGGIDNEVEIKAVVADQSKYSMAENVFRLDKALNQRLSGTVDVYPNTWFEYYNMTPAGLIEQLMGNTSAHEYGHSLGLMHSFKTFTGAPTQEVVQGGVQGRVDMMNGHSGDISYPNLSFTSITMGALKMAADVGYTITESTNALDYYTQNIVGGGFYASPVGGPEDGNYGTYSPSGPILYARRVDIGNVLTSALDFGATKVDGPGGVVATVPVILQNRGVGNLVIQGAELTGAGFSLTGLTPNLTLAPGATATVTLRFDPTVVGAGTGTLRFVSNDLSGLGTLRLAGFGQSAGPHLSYEMSNNNFGGVDVDNAAGTTRRVTLRNDGSQLLRISSIALTEGLGEFALNGVPANLAAQPIELAFGQTFSFDLTFTPSHLGLVRGRIAVTSNDADRPVMTVVALGTGYDDRFAFDWGRDYVVVTSNGNDLRATSGADGRFEFFLPAQTGYMITVFDLASGLVATGNGVTPVSGRGTDLTSGLVFRPSTAPDTDGDGLPDDIELAIGTSPNKRDTSGSGIDDFTKVMQGLDLFGNRPIATGVIASLALPGTSQAITLVGSPTDAQGQTAFVASGTAGLAVVDATDYKQPSLLGQLALPGDSVDIDVDSAIQIAAVAAGAGGLHVVNVADPAAPALLRTLAVNAGAVKVVDGVAYAAVGSKLHAYDLQTGERLQILSLGGGAISSIAHERTFLYTLDANRVLRAIDLNTAGSYMVARGSVSLPAGTGKLFVGGGVAYVAAGDGNTGGFVTADVSDPTNLRLLSGVDANNLQGAVLAANGSGLALTGGTINGFGGAPVNSLDVVNVSDPTDTGRFLTRFNLPATPLAVALGQGIAFVADGTSGLQVVNYLAPDPNGVAPTITISLPPSSIAGTVGTDIQVVEGSVVPVLASVADDVQVRAVELLVNGQVVSTTVSFPYNFSAALSTIAQNGPGAVTVQVRATDTGGNVGLSNLVSIRLVTDTAAPRILASNLANGTSVGLNFRTVNLDFSEPLSADSLAAGNFYVLGPGGARIDPTSIGSRRNGASVQVTFQQPFPVGSYQLVIKTANLKDRAGNPVGAADRVTSFNAVDFTSVWLNPDGGDWADPDNWDSGIVPGATDNVLIDVPGGVTITFSSGTVQVKSLLSRNPLTITGGTLQVTETVQVDNAFTMQGGTLQGARVVRGSGGQGLTISSSSATLDGVTLDTDLNLSGSYTTVTLKNGLTLNGTATLGYYATLSFSGTQTLGGTGTVQLGDAGILAIQNGNTLTVGPNVTVRGAGYLGGYYVSGDLVNQGTITADRLNATLAVNVNSLSNTGSLKIANGGKATVTGATGSLGNATITGANSALSVDGTNYTIDSSFALTTGQSLSLLGTWTTGAGVTLSADKATLSLGTPGDPNKAWTSGTVTVTNSTVNLGGSGTSLAGLTLSGSTLVLTGSYTYAQVQPLLAGNRLEIGTGGVLDATGATLTLDATTGSLTLSGGTLKGGTVNTSGGARVVVTGSGSELDGVTLNSDLDLSAVNATANVVNGLTLNGTLTFGTNNYYYGNALTFSGTQTLDGTGTVVLASTYYSYAKIGISYGSTLTLGAGITVRGNGVFGQGTGNTTLVNQGTIAADTAGATVSVNVTTLQNQGSLKATSGGKLTVVGVTGALGNATIAGANSALSVDGTNYTVGSSFALTSGQSLSLLGSWTTDAGVTLSADKATLVLGSAGTSTAWTAGTVTATDSTVNLGGSGTSLAGLTLSGSKLVLTGSYSYAQLQPLLAGNRLEIGTGGVLDATGATLTLDATTGSLTLSGGTLKGGTVNASAGAKVVGTTSGGTLDGVTLNGDLDLSSSGAAANVMNGLTLNGTATVGKVNSSASLTFTDTQTLAGSGTVVLAGSSSLSITYNSTLTVGAGVTVRGSGSISGYYYNSSLVNQGTIAADVSGATLNVQASSVQNQGTLKVAGGGILQVFGLTGSLGNVSITGTNSALSVDGANYTVDSSLAVSDGQSLSLLGTWTTGTGVTLSADRATLVLGTPGDPNEAWTADGITATNSTVKLGGNPTTLGALSVTGSTVNLTASFTVAELGNLLSSGNTLKIEYGGVLDNAGNTLALDATTGSLTMSGGTLKGGTVSATGGAKILVTGYATLDGVTVNGDLAVTDAYLTLVNGLTLNGTATLTGNYYYSNTGLTFSGTQTLGGNGTVVLTGSYNSQVSATSGSTLTIGAGITVRGNGTFGYQYSSNTTLINQGSIVSDKSGATLSVGFTSVQNQGTLKATGGGKLIVTGLTGALGNATIAGANSALSVDGTNYTVGSSFALTSGQSLSLLGSWTTDAGVTLSADHANLALGTPGDPNKAWTAGTVTATNSTVNLGGSGTSLAGLSLTNSTLVLTGSYSYAQLQPLLAGNRLEIGTGGVLDATGATLTLDATTGPLTMSGGTLKGGTVNASGGAKVVVTSGATSTLDGVTLNSDLDLSANGGRANVVNGLTLNGTATLAGGYVYYYGETLTFSGTQTLAGTGTLLFTGGYYGYSGNVGITSGSTLTLGAGITVRGTGSIGSAYSSNNTTLVNQGTIAADTSTASVNVTVTTLKNQGTLKAIGGGKLSVTGLTGSLGNVSIAGASSSLSIDGSGYTVDSSQSVTSGQVLSLLGTWSAGAGVTLSADNATLFLGTAGDPAKTWSAAGAVTATSATVNLGGSTASLAGLSLTNSTLVVTGSFTYAQVQALLAGNRLEIGQGGVLDATGATLTLDATTGSLTLSGGTLKGGTVNASGGAKVVVTSSGSTLDGVTLNGDLSATDAYLSVVNGLTLNGTAALSGVNNSASLTFAGTQTLAGSGTVVLTGNSYLSITYNSTLTVGAGVTVRGSGYVGSDYYYSGVGSLVNQGTIEADTAGATLNVLTTSLVNQGAMKATGGGKLSVTGLTGALGNATIAGANSELSVDGTNYTVGSSFALTAGQSLSLLGSWTTDAGVTLSADQATLALGTPGDPNKVWTSGAVTAVRSRVKLGGDGTASLASLSLTNSTLVVTGSYTYAQVQALLAGNRLEIGQGGVLDATGKTLSFDATTGPLTLSGGTLKGATINASGGAKVVVTSSGSSLDGVTLNGDLSATDAYFSVRNGLTLNGTATVVSTPVTSSSMNLTGTQTLGGSGTIVLSGSNAYLTFTDYNSVLTLGSGIHLRGNGYINSYYGGSTLVNQGTIEADVNGEALNFQGVASFQNQGTLKATGGGKLSVTGLTGALGNATIAGANSGLSVDGTNYTVGSSFALTAGQSLSLLGGWSAGAGVTLSADQATLALGSPGAPTAWSVAAPVTATNSTLVLGGSTSSLPSLTLTGSTLNIASSYTYAQVQALLAGNRLEISQGGVLDATGITLSFDATTGPLTLSGGTLKGAIVNASAGAKVVVTSGGVTLDGVTLGSDLDLTTNSGAYVFVLNGLTLNNATVRLGDAAGSTFGRLYFQDTQTLGGNGTVLLGNNRGNFISGTGGSGNSPTLTIGAGITIRVGSGTFNVSSLVNQGTILAENNGGNGSFTVDAGFDNSSAATTSTTNVINTSGVSDAAPATVYQTARYDSSFNYSLSSLAPGASYTVRLHFAELLAYNAGDHQFNVSINGTEVLTNFDILATAGAREKAVVMTFSTTASSDGKITINFSGVKGAAQVNGIELLSGASVVQAINCGTLATFTINSTSLTNQGTLGASGGGVLSVSGLGVNDGILSAGVAGLISISGDLTEGAAGQLNVQLGGTDSSQFGRIVVDGAATLDGTLNITRVNNFVPSVGNNFRVLTYGSHVGTFSTVTGLNIGGGFQITVNYDPLSVNLGVS